MKKEEKNYPDRTPTGVQGFDELIGGGLIKNSVNVVLGGPGAGKTTFLFQYLWNGVTKYNENGMYLSLEPEVVDLFEDAKQYGFDFAKLDATGKCKFVKISPNEDMKKIKEGLMILIQKYNIKRIAIDPISVLAFSIEKDNDVRETLFDFVSVLKRLGATVILAEETSEAGAENMSLGNENQRTQFIKFLADCLINLYSSGLGGVADRAVRISKMRRTAHARGPIPFEITNSGIKISKLQ